MLVHSLAGNCMRLDAGTVFGHVPRTLHQRWIASDREGRLQLANRSLLVEDKGRRVLLEAGIGTFFSPAMRQRHGINGDQHELLRALERLDLTDADIDWVVLSHLHFDHAGGLLAPYRDGVAPKLLFPRARFVVSGDAWQRCQRPHRRDRASFIPELPELLWRSQRLEVVDEESAAPPLLGKRFAFRFSHGHTPGMLHTTVHGERASIFYCADLIPGRPWVHLPVTMGFDRNAEQVVEEKERLYAETALERTVFFFAHDPAAVASSIVEQDGRYAADRAIQSFGGWDMDRTERPTQG